jgi:hypothetical protein
MAGAAVDNTTGRQAFCNNRSCAWRQREERTMVARGFASTRQQHKRRALFLYSATLLVVGCKHIMRGLAWTVLLSGASMLAPVMWVYL